MGRMTSRRLSPSSMVELEIGRDLVLGAFRIWRGDLDCVDALILLVIATANVDGVLFDRELRSRYGGEYPIAPDTLRQPINSHAVSVTLGMSAAPIGRRLAALAERGECELRPDGMIITERQLEASNRTAIVRAVYRLLADAYLRLRSLGVVDVAELPLGTASQPPLRSASAFGAKYVLRTLDALAGQAGGVIGALVLLELLRRTAPDKVKVMWRVASESAGGPAPTVTTAELAAILGLPLRRAQAEVRALRSRGLCERRGRRLAASWDAFPPHVFGRLAKRNRENLYQLLAGLAEIGALARFEEGDPEELDQAAN